MITAGPSVALFARLTARLVRARRRVATTPALSGEWLRAVRWKAAYTQRVRKLTHEVGGQS